MIRSSLFSLMKIEDEYILYPHGQAVADRQRPFTVNETGKAIWEILKDDLTYEQVVSVMSEKYDVSKDDISADVISCLSLMRQKKIIVSESDFHDEDVTFLASGETKTGTFDVKEAVSFERKLTYCIAGEFVCFNERDRHCIPKEFDKFICDGNIKTEDMLTVLFSHDTDNTVTLFVKIMETDEVKVFGDENGILVKYPGFEGIKEVFYKDSLAIVSIKDESTGNFYEEVMRALRECFTFHAAKRKKYPVHSASVLYRGSAILFSAPAGMGKSTHARLWETYENASIINGDLNFCGIKDGKLYAFGAPWCGTSGICGNGEYPVLAVFMLKQGTENMVGRLKKSSAILGVAARTVSLLTDERSAADVVSFAKEVTKSTPVLSLACTEGKEAYETVKNFIDREVCKNAKADIEKLLKDGETVMFSPMGTSMYPLFVTDKDMAVVIPADKLGRDIKRFDVCLFRDRSGKLVIHRLFRKKDGGYMFLGDHQKEPDGPYGKDAVIGVMVEFTRKGKKVDTSNLWYRFVFHVWLWLRPLRPSLIKIGSIGKKFYKSICG